MQTTEERFASIKGYEETAKRIAKAIKRNVASFDRVSHDTFGTRNRRLWDMVCQGETPIIGTDCEKRNSMVCMYLGAWN